MPETVKLAEYLFTRLRQLGVETIHGVPGDYNLELLDYVEPSGLHWTGSCNELNGGYAADGYARIKGVGALITTFGVGELSAINAIAGAYAELAPVVHIVGMPSRQQNQSRALIHHTLNDGEYGRFADMYKHVTIAQADLSDPRTATQLLDAALAQSVLHSRPVYIQVPLDMATKEVDSAGLADPVRAPLVIEGDDHLKVSKLIIERMCAGKKPMILVDGESLAYGILEELDQLIKKTGWPTWTSNFGKGCVDETLPNTRGVYMGIYATKEDQEYFNSADFVLCFGPHFSGVNSYFGSSIPSTKTTIFFKETSVVIGDDVHRDLPAKLILSAVVGQIETASLQDFSSGLPPFEGVAMLASNAQDTDKLTQRSLFSLLQGYLRPGDVILGETGTAGYGARAFKLPKHSRLFNPVTWLSIGYMLPATQGAALAQRELDQAGKWQGREKGVVPRALLLIGDGSFQMTVQELSTIIREKLNVTIVLLNNDGYTIERCIHGKDQGYNDVARWKYLKAPALFGAGEEGDYKAHTAMATSVGELRQALEQVDGRKSMAGLEMIEVMLDREDALPPLSNMLEKQM